MPYTYLLWDWNGTLLDDLQISVDAVCDILKETGLPPTTAESYRSQIEIPTERYYQKLFDLQRWPLSFLAERYMQNYRRHIRRARLHKGAAEALAAFSNAGIRQALVSSFQQQLLYELIDLFGIGGYFDFISGAQDCFAKSKIERARNLLAEREISPSRTVVLGDMVHDAEMAAALGSDCILLSCGHQSREALERCGLPIAESLSEAAAWILCG